jgi:hypothetical protein
MKYNQYKEYKNDYLFYLDFLKKEISDDHSFF